MSSKTMLSLEWTSYPSRDTETATLVRNYLRLNGIEVISGSVHNAFYLLNKHRPNLVYMTNIIGAEINFKVACYCRSKNIKLITSISEGDLKEHMPQMIWGHNSLQNPVESKILLWSDFQREKFIEQNVVYKSISKVTGNPGADRYKFCEPSKLIVDRTGYNFIVGVGCYTFKVNSTLSTDSADMITKNIPTQNAQRDAFSKQLDELVSIMPKVLFLLKMHPGGLQGEYGAGIERAARRRNVRVLSKDASIFDCIATADVWMSYESNTAMEAWLMKKPTGLLNPLGTNFPRSDFYRGQPNFSNASEWRDALDNFSQTTELPGFKELECERTKIVKKVIGWDDGLNHVRTGNAILKAFFQNQSMKRPPLPSHVIPGKKERIKRSISFLAKQLGLIRSTRRKWSSAELSRFEALRMKQQIKFYERLDSNWLEKLKVIE